MILRTLAALPLLLALPTLLLSEEPHPAPLPLGLGAVDGAGVNIHFTTPRSSEMKMLAEGGFRWVRMDFAWGGTERERGRYDFAAYDQLLAALAPHKIRAVLILDYSNRWYDRGLSPASDEGRQAFARWAAAAAVHFRGRHVLWEMYNEFTSISRVIRISMRLIMPKSHVRSGGFCKSLIVIIPPTAPKTRTKSRGDLASPKTTSASEAESEIGASIA